MHTFHEFASDFDAQHTLGLQSWEARLRTILKEMELCKAGLSTRRLDPEQTAQVGHLISVLERHVEQLDRSVMATLCGGAASPELSTSHTTLLLNDLAALCADLASRIFRRPPSPELSTQTVTPTFYA